MTGVWISPLYSKKPDNRVFHRKTNHQLTFGVLADPLYIGSDSAGTKIRKSKILYGRPLGSILCITS